MRSAKDFFAPLAVGAPAPLRDVPARPSRMIHFFDPSNPKMAAKVPDLVGSVDVLLGNLEDAVKADNKEAARQGLVDIAKATRTGPATTVLEGISSGLESAVWALIAVAVAHVTQCPYCIKGHTKLALRKGASPEEVMEAIWVAAEMRAGGAYAHAAIAIEAINELERKQHE